MRFWKSSIPARDPSLSANAQPLEANYLLDVGSLSDTGLTRSNNQDSIGFIRFPDDRNLLAIVADGMGGHQGGEIASQIAVATIQKKFSAMVGKKNASNALKKAFLDANEAIFNYAGQSPALTGMGTTLVALALLDGRISFANVGDSRIYRFRGLDGRQLSQDHTLVEEMLRNGLIDRETAENHPDKNVITRAIGTHAKVQIDSTELPLPVEVGDSFLLCSDGLYDLVAASEMAQCIVDNSAQQACKLLVDLANKRGGYDNVSVIVIKILQTSAATGAVPITRF